MLKAKTFVAVATLIGTIAGAGFLAIPYVAMKSGFPIVLLHMLVIAVVLAITMLYLGEIVLRTKQHHQLAGYAEKYLSKTGKNLMFVSLLIGVYSALLAYLIAEGESFSYLFFGNANYQLYFGLAFWLLLSVLSFKGLAFLKKGEPVGVALVLVFVISIAIFLWNKIDINNLTYVNTTNIFIPFGVILFAFLGFSAIPTVRDILVKDKNSIKRTIFISYIIIFILYAIFTAVILGCRGNETPEIATLALGKPFIILGMISMFTAFLALSNALMNSYKYDFKLSKNSSWFLTVSAPLILFILLEIIKKAEFIRIMGIGGVLSGGLNAILILLMVKSAKMNGDRKPEYSIPYSKILTYILILFFIIGALMEIFY